MKYLYKESTITVADVDGNALSDDVKKFLSKVIVYEDREMDEHMSNASEFEHVEGWKDLPKKAKITLRKLEKEAATLGAAYIRLIYR